MGLDMYLCAQVDAPAGSELAQVIDHHLEAVTFYEDDLTACVSGWEFSKDPDRAAYAALVEATGIPRLEDSPHAHVTKEDGGYRVDMTIYYWRKANAIHRWFVEHCQDGIDECQASEVHVELLVDLLQRCQKITADHALAHELLPTSSGYFFGSTDYDDWYFEDVACTAVGLRPKVEALIARPGTTRFVYRSSW